MADNDYPIAYAGFITSEEIRKKSSSGGVFSALALYVLNANGVVAGCALDRDMKAVHVIAECEADLEPLRGSKYVQSHKGDIYTKVLEHLKLGSKVLFVGTPCECGGIKSLVDASGTDASQLILCDFICHGVPSPMIFDSYLKNTEKKLNDKITDYRFRLKDHGWNQSGLQLGVRFETKNNNVVRRYPAYKDPFMCGFLEDIYLRPSCYDCRFKTAKQDFCDITIADFWGIDKVDKTLNDGKGISLILAHNDKSQKMLEAIDDLALTRVDAMKALKGNKTIIKSAELPAERTHFFKAYASKGYEYAEKKYMNTAKWVVKTSWRVLHRIIETVLERVFALAGIHLNERQLFVTGQFIQFCMVGVSNALVSYLLNISVITLTRPYGIKYDYMIANVTAFVLSVLWSYHWNNRYVFAEGEEKRHKTRTLTKAYLTYAFSGIVLNNLLSTLWIGVLGLSKYIAPLLNIPFTMPVNFLISKFWTYRHDR